MIAFLIKELNIRGGTHKQFLKLLEFTESKGEEFYIITKDVDLNKTYPGFIKYKDKIKIFEAEKRTNKNPLSLFFLHKRNSKKLAQLLRNADVVNIHDPGFETYFDSFKNIPTVWQVNDLPPSFRVGVSAKNNDSLKNWIKRNYYLRLMKYIDKFTVNVTKNATRIKEKFSRDAEVLYCGIEPIGISHKKEASFEHFKYKHINLLSSGVWFPYRNYETQVEAVKILVDKGYDVTLNIIGSTKYSPEYMSQIENLINKYGLSDRITICGMVDEDRFKQLHEEADIFMFINVDQSWGLAVFEAMSCGIPVIVSESVGATEILHDGVDSVFVNPLSPKEVVNKILMLAADEKLYSDISSNASVFHKGYTWDNAYSSKIFDILMEYKK